MLIVPDRRAVIGAAAVLGVAAFSSMAHAQDAAPPSEPEVFELGEIIVTGRRPVGLEVTPSVLNAEAIRTFSRTTLDEAAALMPGVSASTTGGARNERLLFVRGFDRLQVPLSIDGIRVYLPADNRLDFGRLLTPDSAEVQVTKGYPSVIDGPGALGGQVNLVTRRPADDVEAEARSMTTFDRTADAAAHSLFALVGGRRDRWYAQASYARNDRDHFTLSDGYAPTANENGGERELSDSEDWRFNIKLGVTPNATDEYVLSYTRQEGEKNAPIETTVPLPVARFWSWPYWNLDSLYFLSTTALGERATLRTRAYRNTFENLLRAFDDRSQTRQSLPRAFNSFYEDEAYGASGRVDLELTPENTLRAALHYRRDEHVEFQQLFPSAATEPRQTSTEDTWSLALENVSALAPNLDLTVGASYDWRKLDRAEDFSGVPGTASAAFIRYKLRDGEAWNAQGRLDWRPSAGRSLHASISSRTRFPTLFERFSSRFGGATSAPGLQEERATQIEIGGELFGPRYRLEGAVFHASLSDVVFAFPTLFFTCTSSTTPPAVPTPGCAPQSITQSRNLGEGNYYGAEAAGSVRLDDELTLGGNYSFIERDLRDPSIPAFQPTGVPRHKALVFLQWSPFERLRLTPAVELASDRYVANTAGTRYFRDGAYALASIRAEYALSPRLELAIGGRNLLDDNYQLADGFPEEGRTFFIDLRANY